MDKSSSINGWSQRLGERLADGYASQSLRTLLIIPFITLITLAVTITGLVGFKKSQKAIQILAQKYSSEIAQRIQSELRATLDLAFAINAANADAVELGLLDFGDPDELERYFWPQLHRNEAVNYIYVGNEDGGVRGVGRTQGATNSGYEYRSFETIDNDGNDFRAGVYYLYQADEKGVRKPITDDIDYVGLDVRTRPWYKSVANKDKPAWSDIYLYFGEQFLGIAASHPVYDANQVFQGVFAADVELGQLNDFLATLDIGQSGHAFIIERNGAIVASSTTEAPFRITDYETRTQERRLASESQEPLIAKSTELLMDCFGALEQVPLLPEPSMTPACGQISDRSLHDFHLEIDRERYFGHIVPFQHQQGLEWLIVVVLPESDVMETLGKPQFRAFGICVVALAIAIPFGIWFLNWVTHPLEKLSEASQAIAAGDFSPRLDLSRRDQIGLLSRAFDRMADQVQTSVNSLQEQVAERTQHLEEARREAEDANRAKSQFLANMSHELRTPLNGILGYAQVLQRDRQLDSKKQRGLKVIYDSGQHLLGLINEVLDLSKIEAQRMELQPKPFVFRPFLDAIADLVRLRAEQKGIQFFYEVDSSLPVGVLGDEQKLRQVLINLLSNAIKFTEHGRVTFQVMSIASVADATGLTDATGLMDATEEPQQTIQFQIEDTGRGIAPEDQSAIFQPFRQVGEQRTQEGTGLGLAISHQLVDLMGGHLRLTSQLNQGSCFQFDLVLPSLSAEECQMGQAPGHRISNRYIIGIDGPPQRVLIIDDIIENRAFVADLLTSIGFEVFEANNGETGLAMLKDIHPNVILMDLIMPVMDGFTTASTLRHDPAWHEFRSLPIIAMSASTLQQGKPQSLAAGCNAFLLKPIDTDELLTLLQTHLDLTWQYSHNLDPETSHHGGVPSGQAVENPANTTPVSPSTLIAPPQEVLEILWESAQLGDISGILDIVDQLNDPALAPFAAQLQQLVTEFRMKEIQDFLTSFRLK